MIFLFCFNLLLLIGISLGDYEVHNDVIIPYEVLRKGYNTHSVVNRHDAEAQHKEDNNTEEETMYTMEESNRTHDMPKVCSNDANYVNSAEDMEILSRCTIVYGSIEIQSFPGHILNFGDIEEIKGNLVIENNPTIVRLESDRLSKIGGSMKLRELTSLAVISFPNLDTINSIDWKILPILSTILLQKDLAKLERIRISDTSLSEFSGFKLDKIKSLDINNNRDLSLIDCCVQGISENLHIAANSRDIKVLLPRLTSVKNMSVHDVSEVDFSSLQKIQASANIINNQFSSLKMPQLKSVKGTLSLLKNGELNELEFANLTEIDGGLMIINNTNINKIDFFPNLVVIGGAIELTGPFSSAEFKNLRLIKGSAKLKTDSIEFDCTKWQKTGFGAVVRGGKMECSNGGNSKIEVASPNGKDKAAGISNGTDDTNATSKAFKCTVSEHFFYIFVFVACFLF